MSIKKLGDNCRLLTDLMPLLSPLEAFDTWSLHKVLRIPHTRNVTKATVKQTTSCPRVFQLIQQRRLHFSGYLAHHRVTEASLWSPSTTWLRATDTDVQSVNIGICSACRKVSDCTLWRRMVDTAALHQGSRHWRKKRKRRCPSVAHTTGL